MPFRGRTYQKSLNLPFLLCLCPVTTARSIKQQTNVAPPPHSLRLHFAFAMFVSKFFNLLHKMLGFLASHKSQRNCFNLSWQFSLSSSDKTRRGRRGACLCLRSEFNLVLAAASFGNFHGIQSTNVGLRRLFICFDVICNFHLPRSKEIVECDAIISRGSGSQLELTNQQRREREKLKAVAALDPEPFPFLSVPFAAPALVP